jgi:hypothetical protein
MPRDCEAFLFVDGGFELRSKAGLSVIFNLLDVSTLSVGPFLMAPVATFGVLNCLFFLLSVVAKRVELCAQSSLFAVQERSI